MALRIPCLRAGLVPLPTTTRKQRQVLVHAKLTEILMPHLTSTMTTGRVSLWEKEEGDKVRKGDILVQLESDKANMNYESFYDGYLAAIVVETDQEAPVDSILGVIVETPEEIPEAKAKYPPKGSEEAVPQIPISTEPMSYKQPEVPSLNPKQPEETVSSKPLPTSPRSEVHESIVVSAIASSPLIKKRITYNIEHLEALYNKINSKGVTIFALLVKAAGLALLEHPIMNACSRDDKAVAYNSRINISVMDGENTFVLQSVDKIDVYSLSRKWKELAGKPTDIKGTFTMSNRMADATLPPGTGAIMAFDISTSSSAPHLDVEVTADSRIISHADHVAAFLKTFAKIIEKPYNITL